MDKSNRYVAIDLETTGLSPNTAKILEIGAVRVIDGKITETLSELVNPGTAVPWRITQLTGITQEMADGGILQPEAVRRIIDFIGDDVVVGHNVTFDLSFIKKGALNYKVREKYAPAYVDTLTLARKFLPQLESRSLESLCDYFGIRPEHHHRAVDDAITAKEVYERLKDGHAGECEKCFESQDFTKKIKKDSPITDAQKRYLNDLVKYHKINLDCVPESLTKSEASRKIDTILREYGRIVRRY